MKKIARWALAFAAVMSMSGGAMALPQGKLMKVVGNNGRLHVPVGTWISNYVMESDHDPLVTGCVHAVKWSRKDFLVRSTTLHLLETLPFPYYSCQEAAEICTPSSFIHDPSTPIPSYGFDVYGHQKPIYHLMGTMDEVSCVAKFIYSFSPLEMARYMTVSPA